VSADKGTWTGRLRESALEAFPPERLLPDRQPAYVASWAYVFGALSIGAFAVVLLSGAVLAVEGPAWWHGSNVGLFVNSTHLWSTEFFFMFMVVHLWAKFFMAAWRGRRKATWITGVLAFVISIAAAFTGYLSQQNFDSEWIGTQAKDGINSTGAGAFWNVLNFGQMLMWHIVLLPLVVAAIIGLHVLLVRRRGVVPPFAATQAQLAKAGLSFATSGLAPATTVLPQEPFLDVPIAQQPLLQEPMSQQTLVPEPLLQEPAAQPVLQEPTRQQPLVPEPLLQEPATQEPIVQRPVLSEPLLSEPLLDETSAAEPKADEPAAPEQLWHLPEDES
jgi:ubiquinol-cytochrome c reductase cytochrome b subunit